MGKKVDTGIPGPPERSGGSGGKPETQSENTKQPESSNLVALNFKVSPEVKKDFKVWAAAHNKNQRAVLEEAFKLLKQHYL
jgi:hypothetical protein